MRRDGIPLAELRRIFSEAWDVIDVDESLLAASDGA